MTSELTIALVGLGGAVVGSLATQAGETFRQSRVPKKEKKERQMQAVAEFLECTRTQLGGVSFPKIPAEIANRGLDFWTDEAMDAISPETWNAWSEQGEDKFQKLNTIIIAWEKMHLRLTDNKVKAKSLAVREQLRTKHSESKASVRQLTIVKYAVHFGTEFYQATSELRDTAIERLN